VFLDQFLTLVPDTALLVSGVSLRALSVYLL
jgi:hypothetical protein